MQHSPSPHTELLVQSAPPKQRTGSISSLVQACGALLSPHLQSGCDCGSGCGFSRSLWLVRGGSPRSPSPESRDTKVRDTGRTSGSPSCWRRKISPVFQIVEISQSTTIFQITEIFQKQLHSYRYEYSLLVRFFFLHALQLPPLMLYPLLVVFQRGWIQAVRGPGSGVHKALQMLMFQSFVLGRRQMCIYIINSKET